MTDQIKFIIAVLTFAVSLAAMPPMSDDEMRKVISYTELHDGHGDWDDGKPTAHNPEPATVGLLGGGLVVLLGVKLRRRLFK